jgi:Domain of unknown function (DUF4279)
MFGLFKKKQETHNSTTPKQKAAEPVICDRFAASLGISGDGLDLAEISRTLGLTPTIARPKGGHKVKWNDQWVYQAPVAKERPLDEHIMALWDAIRPQIPYLREIKEKHQVEIVCSYIGCYFRGNFKVDRRCLGLFEELDIPFRIAVSISIANMIPPTKAQVDAKMASILEQTRKEQSR